MKALSKSQMIISALIILVAAFSILAPQLRPFVFVIYLGIVGFLMSRKIGGLVAVTFVFLSGTTAVFLSSTLAFLWNIPLNYVALTLFIFLSILTLWGLLSWQSLPKAKVPSPRLIALFIGPAIVLVTAIAGRLGQVFPVMSWIMRGDTANNVVFAWQIFSDNGVDLSYPENPVPFPANVIAFMAALQAPGDRISFVWASLVGISIVWTLTVALTALALSLLVDHVSGEWSPTTRVYKTILLVFSSLVPLSWLFSGYPLETGFFGAQLAILILLSSFALVLSSKNNWVIAIGLYAGLLLTLMTWSPLAIAVAVILAIHLIKNMKELLFSFTKVLFQIFFIAIILAVSLTATLPSFLNRSDTLADAVGGIHVFVHIIVPILFTINVGFAVILFLRGQKKIAVYSVAFLSTVFLGLLFLLALRRGEETLWAYYQLKYEWFFLLMLISLGIVLVAGLISTASQDSNHEKSGWAIVAVLAMSTVVVLPGGNTTQAILGNFVAQTLVMEPGREEPDGVFNSFWDAYNQKTPTVLWGSENPDEFFVDFWLLQMHSDNILDPLRGLAYTQNLKDMNQLCQISTQLKDSSQVITKDEELEAKFTAQCPENTQTTFVVK
jgi:hypothetical protein